MSEDLASLLGRLARERPADAPAAGEETNARIVAAALELFAERSYEAATTQAIARRAGVTEKTLFRHFGSKEALFERTVYPALLRLLRPVAVANLVATIQATQGGFAPLVRAIVADRVAFGLAHPAIVKLIAQEVLLHPGFRQALVPVAQEALWPHMEPILAGARARGEMRDVEPPVAMRTLVSIVAGFLLERTLFGPDAAVDEAAAVDELTALVLGALGGPNL